MNRHPRPSHAGAVWFCLRSAIVPPHRIRLYAYRRSAARYGQSLIVEIFVVVIVVIVTERIRLVRVFEFVVVLVVVLILVFVVIELVVFVFVLVEVLVFLFLVVLLAGYVLFFFLRAFLVLILGTALGGLRQQQVVPGIDQFEVGARRSVSGRTG